MSIANAVKALQEAKDNANRHGPNSAECRASLVNAKTEFENDPGPNGDTIIIIQHLIELIDQELAELEALLAEIDQLLEEYGQP